MSLNQYFRKNSKYPSLKIFTIKLTICIKYLKTIQTIRKTKQSKKKTKKKHTNKTIINKTVINKQTFDQTNKNITNYMKKKTS